MSADKGMSGLGKTVALVADIPVGYAPDHNIPLRTLHGWWRDAKEAYHTCPLDDDDPAMNVLCRHIVMLEELGESFIPKTAEDWAFKVIFADDGGKIPRQGIVQMVFRQVGIEPVPVEDV